MLSDPDFWQVMRTTLLFTALVIIVAIGAGLVTALLFNRPFPGYAQYRGPVRGFYMCGSGTHPGGGVMAAPGANAAREILMDLGRPNIVPEGWSDD